MTQMQKLYLIMIQLAIENFEQLVSCYMERRERHPSPNQSIAVRSLRALIEMQLRLPLSCLKIKLMLPVRVIWLWPPFNGQTWKE